MKSLGVMLDCSRDAVMRPEKVKEFARIIADMGYNMLQLYTEETYELKDEPFFGHFRGRYSWEELKDIDSYCQSIGIELVPCIQVLAHLNQLVQWKTYGPLFDCNDILMVGEEPVYELIEKMFETISNCFTSKRVNVGMDEAMFIGRGRYQDKHGYRNRVKILAEHLKRVKEIADKHGVTLMMWSDMFIRMHNNQRYYGENIKIPQETIDSVPEGIQLIYWDYYSKEKSRYDNMLRTHLEFNNPIAFAGGLWTWIGFTPSLRFSLDATEAAMRSVTEHAIDTVFFTMWGDDGKECSFFNMLPALFAASQMANGNFDREDIAKKFEKKYGYSFEEFMNLELANLPSKEDKHPNNPAKYLLYNDLFVAKYDYTVGSELAEQYGKASKLLRQSIIGRDYDYLFDVQAKLLDVLAMKCNLGIRIRDAYSKGEKQILEMIAEREIPEIISRMKVFFETFRRMWLKENKAFGLEVHEQRIGGAMYRLESCKERIQMYLAGKIETIEELEEETLLPEGMEKEKPVCSNQWRKMVTTSII